MHAATKRRARQHYNQLSHQLPRHITQQLENIYARSMKNVKRHPYQVTSIILGVALASSAFFLLRYLKNNK